MNTPEVTYRVYAQRGWRTLNIASGFQTRHDAQQFIDDHSVDLCAGLDGKWHIDIEEEKSQKQLYYEFIDSLLENARKELSQQEMVELINDLGVVLDMHFDGIRREVEDNFDGLMKRGEGLYAEE